MKNDVKVLISNVELHSNKIGSWTNRISKLLEENPGFFQHVLSPTKSYPIKDYCIKKSFITYNKKLRRFNLKYRVAKDYLKRVQEISKIESSITLVIMDDAALLESFCLFKSMFSCDVKIIYSFHGFKLDINEEIINEIDKVLFLTKLSYKDALYRYNVFSPEIEIVGNGVDSSVFFPSKNEEEKFKLKKQLGFDKKDIIICWLSNNRRKKGLHLFIKIIDEINKLNLPIQFLIIGSSSNIDNKNVLNLGRVLNSEIAKYLQISDYYFFTSLWKEGFGLSLIEAIKCGNTVITSNVGGIPEVIEGLKNINLVKNPNIIENWLEVFKKSYTEVNHRIKNEEASLIWNYKSWEKKFIKSIS